MFLVCLSFFVFFFFLDICFWSGVHEGVCGQGKGELILPTTHLWMVYINESVNE